MWKKLLMVFFFFDFAIFLCLFCKYFCCVGYEGSAHTNVFTNVTKLPTICYTIKLLRIGLDVNNCKRIFLDFFLAYCYASSDVLYHIYTTSNSIGHHKFSSKWFKFYAKISNVSVKSQVNRPYIVIAIDYILVVVKTLSNRL